MPKIVAPNFIRTAIATLLAAAGGSATVAPAFVGTGALTLYGPITVPAKCAVEKLVFRVADTAGAGSSADCVFHVRRDTAAGSILATCEVKVADATIGAEISGAVAAADDEASKLVDGDVLYITRDASGTAFTTLQGVFEIVARQPAQAKA